MGVGILGSPDDLLVGGILFAKSYVFFDTCSEQDGLLVDHAYVGAQPFYVVVFEIAAID